MTVLLIDDDAVGVAVREHLLRVSGFDVVSATTGSGGLALFRDRPFDAAVVDYCMPDVIGDGLIDALRAVRASTALILLSGRMCIPEETLAKVDGVVIKGEGAGKLLATLRGVNA